MKQKQVKKQRFESIINSEWHENKDLQEKAEKVKMNDEDGQIICEFEKIIK